MNSITEIELIARHHINERSHAYDEPGRRRRRTPRPQPPLIARPTRQ